MSNNKEYSHEIAHLIRRQLKDTQIDLSPLDLLQESNQASAILQNWNRIIEVVQKIQEDVGDKEELFPTDTKSLLIAQDAETFGIVYYDVTSLIDKHNAKDKGGDKIHFNSNKNNAMLLFDTPEPKKPTVIQAKPQEPLQEVQNVQEKPQIQKTELTIETCETSLQFVLLTLKEALNLPNLKQAAAFLTNDNKYLVHACTKGLKNQNFGPIAMWYNSTLSNIKRLRDLIQEEQNSYLNVIKVYMSGMQSHNKNVAELSQKVVCEILQLRIGDMQEIRDIVPFEHLIDESGSTLLNITYRDNMYEFLSLVVEKTGTVDEEVLRLIDWSEQHRNADLQEAQKLALNHLLEKASPEQDNRVPGLITLLYIWKLNPKIMEHPFPTQDVKIISYSSGFSNAHQEGTSITYLDVLLKHLVKCCRDKDPNTRSSTIKLSFKHLKDLASQKSPQAASLYKLLVYSFLENFDEFATRELMTTYFCDLLNNQKNIPVHILADPLIRKHKQVMCILKCDLSLLECIGQHKKLRIAAPGSQEPGNAIDFVDYMAQMIIAKQGIQVKDLLLQTFQRFKENDEMIDFMKKFVGVALNEVVEKQRDVGHMELQREDSFFEDFDPKVKSFRLNKDMLMDMVEFIIQISNNNLKQDIIQLISGAQNKYREIFKNHNEDLQNLYNRHAGHMTSIDVNQEFVGRGNSLDDFLQLNDRKSTDLITRSDEGEDNSVLLKRGNEIAVDILDETRSVKQFAQNISIDQEGNSRAVELYQSDPRVKSKPVSEYDAQVAMRVTQSQDKTREPREAGRQDVRVRRSGSINRQLALPRPSQDDQNSIIDSQGIVPAGSPRIMKKLVSQNVRMSQQDASKKRALDHIEAIKFRKQQQERLKKQEQERQLSREKRQKRNLQRKLQERKVELGLQDVTNLQQLVAYTPSTEASSRDDLKHKELFELVQLDLEEKRDSDAVLIFQQKHSKLFKYLFGKYAMTRTQTSKVDAFDFYSDKTINIVELNKMLRDNGLAANQFPKKHLEALLRLMNKQELGYQDFLQFTVQIAWHLFRKDSSFVPADCLAKLVGVFKDYNQQKGLSTAVFMDPKLNLTTHQKSKIEEIEKRIRDGAGIIPEGYTTYKETEQTVKYVAPPFLPESKKIAVEMVDEILFSAVGIRFLEGIVSVETVTKVRPRLALPSRQSVQTAPIEEITHKRSKSVRKLSPVRNSKSRQSFARVPKPAPQGLIQSHGKNAQMVYDILQQIIDKSSESQVQKPQPTAPPIRQAPHTQLPPRPTKFKNQAVLAKQEREEQALKEQLEKDQKFRLRQKQLRQALSEQRTKKGQEQNQKESEDKAAQEKLEKQQKIQNQKKIKERMEQLEKRKKEKEEEKERMLREKAEEEKRARRAKSLASKAFLEQQKKKQEEEFEKMRKEKDQDIILKDEEQAKLANKKQQSKARVERFLSIKAKEQKEKEQKEKDEERESMSHYCNRQDIKAVFQNHEPTLYPIFKQYATQDKVQKVGEIAQIISMSSNEYQKFCRQYDLGATKIPSKDDLNQLFNGILRERKDAKDDELEEFAKKFPTQICYNEFLKVLVRAQILWSQGTQRNDSDTLQGQILKYLPQNTPTSLETFLYKVEGKSLKGYAKQRTEVEKLVIEQPYEQATPMVQDKKVDQLEESALEQPTPQIKNKMVVEQHTQGKHVDLEESIVSMVDMPQAPGTIQNKKAMSKIAVNQEDAEAIKKMLEVE